ncbi:MAG: hypothetical protein NTX63_03505 [Candidatus Peregrinibacteria bacterium]|nr:hypothetical protein [Candidatus Peregrinibacteria bacterium]
METSLFLAKALGLYMAIACFGLLVNSKARKAIIHAFEDEGQIVLSGITALVLGILIVISHNVWVYDWRVIITLSGWAALLKGVARIYFAEYTKKWLKSGITSFWYTFGLVFATALGAYLTCKGFGY